MISFGYCDPISKKSIDKQNLRRSKIFAYGYRLLIVISSVFLSQNDHLIIFNPSSLKSKYS